MATVARKLSSLVCSSSPKEVVDDLLTLSGFATAMAEIMKLDAPTSEGTPIDVEIKKRVWWTLYTTDIWCISGQGLPSHMQHIRPSLPLPMNDLAFNLLGSNEHLAGGDSETGIWGQLMTLVPSFSPIHNINRSIADGEPYTAELDQRFHLCMSHLEDWKRQLPSNAQMSQENLKRQQKDGLGGVLISVHLAYHHFSTLLYFRYLKSESYVSPSSHLHATRCREHASAFSALVSQSQRLKGCDMVYPNISHMLTVSSSVLVHALLFGSLYELDSVRQALQENFETLVELTRYWPSAHKMV
jgi:hypothetical protein